MMSLWSQVENVIANNISRRAITEENIRKIQKIKRSYYVTIPVELVREFGWKAGREVVAEKRGKEIVIRDRRR